jgi:hypothetical protein
MSLIRQSPGRAVTILARALVTVRQLTKDMEPRDVKAARQVAHIISID